MLADHVPDIADNPLLKNPAQALRVTDRLHGNTFWVRQADPHTGALTLLATPLFLALC